MINNSKDLPRMVVTLHYQWKVTNFDCFVWMDIPMSRRVYPVCICLSWLLRRCTFDAHCLFHDGNKENTSISIDYRCERYISRCNSEYICVRIWCVDHWVASDWIPETREDHIATDLNSSRNPTYYAREVSVWVTDRRWDIGETYLNLYVSRSTVMPTRKIKTDLSGLCSWIVVRVEEPLFTLTVRVSSAGKMDVCAKGGIQGGNFT